MTIRRRESFDDHLMYLRILRKINCSYYIFKQIRREAKNKQDTKELIDLITEYKNSTLTQKVKFIIKAKLTLNLGALK